MDRLRSYTLMMALCLLIYSGTATLMFGALLNREPDLLALMVVFHFRVYDLIGRTGVQNGNSN